MRGERRRLETLLVPQPEGQQREHKVPSSMPDEDLVNALAQYLEFDPVEKQALLERDGLLDRCRSLIELLEMKVLAARHSWDRDGLTDLGFWLLRFRLLTKSGRSRPVRGSGHSR